jgi:organic radical activating enzyme
MTTNKFSELSKTDDPTCLYKWAWSTIFLQTGRTSSCHRTWNDQVDHTNFETFHNTPTKLETRQAMLDGQWPGKGCEYCKKIEESGGVSDRVDLNGNARIEWIPKELLANNRAINITPTMVEVYFSNLCNMACVYCDPGYSSTWEVEARKHNLYSKEFLDKLILDKDKYSLILEKFWQWLDKNAANLERYNILGGEPFYQDELEKNIEFFETHPCPNLKLTIFSNLKVNEKKFRTIMDKVDALLKKKHLKEVKITASIDCWGPQQEYVRYGIDLAQWEKNFSILVHDYVDIELELHGTMSGLTIKTIPELTQRMNTWNVFRRSIHKKTIYQTFNLVVHPPAMAPGIFPTGFFDADFDKIISVVENESDKQTIRGYQSTINSAPHRPELIEKLKAELTAIDKRRNLNWKDHFSWLEEINV